MLFPLGKVVPGAECGNTQGRFEGRRLRPTSLPTSGAAFTGREAWPRQRRETSVPRPAATSPPSSSPHIEEVKTPRVPAAMGEQPRAAATKIFGGPAETCEEKIQSHLRSLRKVLAEFLDWKVSEEKRRVDYLVRVPSAFRQPRWLLGYFFPQKQAGSSPRRVPAPCKTPNPVGAAGADPGQVWRAPPPCAAAYYRCFKSLYFRGAAAFYPRSNPKGKFVNVELTLPPASQGPA